MCTRHAEVEVRKATQVPDGTAQHTRDHLRHPGAAEPCLYRVCAQIRKRRTPGHRALCAGPSQAHASRIACHRALLRTQVQVSVFVLLLLSSPCQSVL